MVVAGAEYEVNISLNTKTIDEQLKGLETRINKMRRSINGPLSALQRQATLEDRIKATRVISFRLGTQLNALEEKGVNVAKMRKQIKAATTNIEKKELETARARNKIVGDFIKQEERAFKTGQKNQRMQAESIDAMQRARDVQSRFRAQLNQLEAQGVNVRKQRNQLGKLSTAQAKGEFGTFKQLTAILKNSIRNEQSKLTIQKRQTTELEKQARLKSRELAGAPMRFPSGDIVRRRNVVGPFLPPVAGPAAGPSSPVGAGAAQRVAATLAKQTASVQRSALNLMRLAGRAGRLVGRTARLIDSSNLRQANAATLPSSEMLQARAKKSGQDIVQLKTKEVQLEERIAQARGRSAERSAAVRRETERTIPALQAARRAMPFDDSFGPQLPSRTSAPLTGLLGGFGGKKFGGFDGKRAGDIALGAGFPLLFGGGPGAVLGGALGGATGGGLAAQIALSAIGQQIDALVARVAGVGSAFNELTFNLDTVATSTGIANTETQAQLEKIEQYGSAAQAAQLATELLASRVGGPGRDALKKFGEDAVTLGNNLNMIFTQVLAAIAKLAGPLLEKLAQMAGDTAARGAFDRATGLTGVEAAVQKFRTSRQTIQNARNLRKDLRAAGFTGELPLASKRSAQKFAKDFALESGQKILSGPELKIQEVAAGIQTPEQESAATKAANLIKASQRRVQNLQAEAQKAKEISAIRDKILAAEAAGDKLTVERLKGEERAAEIVRKKARLLARIPKDLDEAQRKTETDVVNQTILAEQIANQEETHRRIAKVIREEQLEAVKELAQVYQGVGDIVKEGLVDGIQSAIRGTKSLTEVLSNMFDRLSNKFMDLAANLALYGNPQGTLSKSKGIFGSLFSAVLPALIPGGGATEGLNVDLVQAYMADGGFVNRPTNAVIGEGGESEYVIPSSKMNEAMGRYARGARGGAVIPDGPGGDASGGMTGGGGSIEVSYSVERINNVNYVTAAEFERGMNQAAKRGAELGRQGVYSDLVNKRSIRSRIGV